MPPKPSHADAALDLDTTLPWGEILRKPPSGVPMLEVFGDFPDDVFTVSRTMMSLLIGVGRNEETRESVLLPYVEARFGEVRSSGEEEEEDEGLAAFSEMLTYENATFWVANLAYDLRAVAKEMKDATGGQTRLERARLEVARFYMALTTQQAIVCTRLLHELVERHPKPKGIEGGSLRDTMRPVKKPALKRPRKAQF